MSSTVFKITCILTLLSVISSKSTDLCGDVTKKCVKNYKCPGNNNSTRVFSECGYKKGIQYVCCPRNGLEASEKCGKYHQKVKNHYIPSEPSTEPYLFDYAYVVALGYGLPKKVQWKCSGSLVSSKFALSAAHCVNLPNFGRVRYARMETEDLGVGFDASYHYIDNTFEARTPRQDFDIIYTVMHPDFDPNTRENDIAVMRLDRKVEFSALAKPACLDFTPVVDKTFEWQLTTVGWGIQHNQEPLKLFRYNHQLVPEYECAEYYKTLGRNVDLNKQICLKDSVAYKDYCHRYGGESVIGYHLKNHMPSVFGIASFGDDCKTNSTMPGVYTRVSYYVDWLEKVMWD